MAPAIMHLLEENNLRDIQYVEPFAGGASLALALLFEEYASVIHINDLSRPVYGFWDSVLNRTQELCERIEQTPVTIEVWQHQRETKPESTEGGRRVSVLKWPKGAPLNLG